MSGRAAALAAAGAVLSGCVLAWAWQGDQTRRVAAYLPVFALAFGAYLLALGAARGLSARGLRLCLAAAVAWRVALVPAPPLLSDDVHRLVWEGRVQNAGGNPYAWADRPGAERWAPLRDATWERMNHRRSTAVYPPLWQLAARGVVAMHDSATAMKAFLVGAELLAWWALARTLRRRRLPRERLLVIAWSPVALVEIAGSGHNDALGLALLALALLAVAERRPWLAALAAGAGALVKVVPGLVALAWARRFRPRHALAPLVLAMAVFAPFAAAGPGLWRSLSHYGRFWRFNESLFAGLAALFGGHEAALAIALALLAVVVGFLGWRSVEPAAAVLAVATAWLVLAPNVLPWYALWLLPGLVLRDAPPLLLLTGTLQLAYLVYPRWLEGWPWHLGWEVRALEYGLPLAAALALALRARGRRDARIESAAA